jgi:hypothetical protein
MKKQTSEQKWVTTKNKMRSYGTAQPTGKYVNGRLGPITRSTTWTNTVRNRFRQKTGEIEEFRVLEIGAIKWCKEHIPHEENNLNDLTDEGLSQLDDMEPRMWWEKQKSFMGVSTSVVQKERQNQYGWNFSTTPKRNNLINLHNGLVPTQGRDPRQDGVFDLKEDPE